MQGYLRNSGMTLCIEVRLVADIVVSQMVTPVVQCIGDAFITLGCVEAVSSDARLTTYGLSLPKSCDCNKQCFLVPGTTWQRNSMRPIEGLRGDMLRMVNENRQLQTSVAQVGVPSASQTEMRKLEEVSQSSHQAAVAQLVQGDRRSVRSMGGDDIRGQSRGSTSVDAALVVGPHHEPVGPCSQYELGGPGIPQVTTGGMPSGVPPGVYVTPEVALTQQYMNRESQMIPGGMPSGMPSSVYCTPVDAMGHSLVNRQLMTLQLAQTGSSQYSPDMFTPTETPYYTVPSTCVRIDTPHWSTEVIPSSSQKAVTDQSQGNSQSQKSQDGQSTVAQAKGGGCVTKHATFEDEKKVLVYDTDATDSEDKVVAADKKSAKKAISSKKSVKKKGR